LRKHHDKKKLEQWLDDAKECGVPALVNLARALRVDIQSLASRGQFYRPLTVICQIVDRVAADGAGAVARVTEPSDL